MEFKLRPWEMSDLDTLVVIADNPNISNNLTNRFPHPYTRESGEGFIKMARSHDPFHIMAIEINNKVAGGVGIHPQDDIFCKNAELGYWLAEPYWGKGVMTNAVRQMVAYGFRKFDIDRIFARPFGSNIGSQKVLEKAGFQLEATFKQTLYKNGRYEDELVYAVRR